MIKEKFDLIVIGAGPAGEKGAAQVAYFGKKVALIERERHPGGAGVNTGTLPSKTFRESALHLSGMASRGLGGGSFDLKQTVTAESLVNSLRRKYMQVADSEHKRIYNNIKRHQITYIQGHASFKDRNRVVVKDKDGNMTHDLNAGVTLIATGSTPHRPDDVPFDDVSVMDSDSVLQIPAMPKSLTIVGAGVIGSEYASIFAALGVEVHLLDGRESLLPFLDTDIALVLMKELQKLGVVFHFKTNVKEIEKNPNSIVVTCEDGKVIKTEALLYAIGRDGNTFDLGLENVGITADKRGQLKVNEHYQTQVQNIYAAGDVIGFPALASTSMDQARLAMCHAFGLMYRQRLPEHLPLGIYTIPEVSAVGETEESAKSKGIDYEIGTAMMAENARAAIMGDLGGMLKILFDAKTLNVIGVHIVSERASEIITPGLFAVRLGVGIDFFIDTVFNYPTLSEAYKYAAYDGLGRLAKRGFETGRIVLGG